MDWDSRQSFCHFYFGFKKCTLNPSQTDTSIRSFPQDTKLFSLHSSFWITFVTESFGFITHWLTLFLHDVETSDALISRCAFSYPRPIAIFLNAPIFVYVGLITVSKCYFDSSSVWSSSKLLLNFRPSIRSKADRHDSTSNWLFRNIVDGENRKHHILWLSGRKAICTIRNDLHSYAPPPWSQMQRAKRPFLLPRHHVSQDDYICNIYHGMWWYSTI